MRGCECVSMGVGVEVRSIWFCVRGCEPVRDTSEGHRLQCTL